MANPQQKSRVGPFTIERVLGRGALGVVYLALDDRLNRYVAIKTLKPEIAGRVIEISQLQQEAHAVAKLNHPNIVPLYDVGELNGVPYLVYEYVDGQSLATSVKNLADKSVFNTLEIALAILDGLAHAHELGIIHCNIKPSNLLLDQQSTVRISDFGISRLLADNAVKNDKTQGSIRYLAPETISGMTSTAQSDVFSTGMVLYELLTGQTAIKATESAEILHEISHADPVRPSAVVGSLDKRIDAIVLNATTRNPADRFPNASAMKQAIKDFIASDDETVGDKKSKKRHGTILSYLMAKIRRNPDFPAFSEHVLKINRLASSDSDTTIIELTNAVLKDYSLTNKLLRLVNSSLYGQFGGHITTVSRAIAILGFDNTRSLAVGLLVFDQLKKSSKMKGFMEANLWCFVSAFVARAIVNKDNRNDTELTFIATLLHKLGSLLVIYYLPKEYEAINNLIEQRGLSEAEASKKVLGLHYHVLGQHVGESWGFPPLLLTAMEPPSAKTIRKGADSSDYVLNIVGFSSALLDIVKTIDPESQTSHFETLLKDYKGVVKFDVNELRAIIERSTEQAAKLMEFPEEWQAEMRAKLAIACGQSVDNTPAEVGGVATEYSSESSRGNEASILLSGINDATNMMMSDAGLNDIFITVLESIYRGLKLDRVILLINDPASKQLVVRFGFAPDLDALEGLLKVSTESSDAIGESLKNHSDLLVENTDVASATVKLPDWYARVLGAKSFGLYPIVVKQVLIGAIYFDSARAMKISAAEVLHIQSLRNQAAIAIKLNS